MKYSCDDCYSSVKAKYTHTIGDGRVWRNVCDDCLKYYPQCDQCKTTICGDGHKIDNEHWLCVKCLVENYRFMQKHLHSLYSQLRIRK